MPRESRLLSHIYERSADLAGAGPILIGPGDDAALLDEPGPLIVTVDQLVEGRHYDPGASSLERIAHKLVARTLSDVAAMAGRPIGAVCAACLRRGFERADELFDHIARAGRRMAAPMIGGDIAVADGPTVLTLTALGTPHTRRGAVTRSGARAGDLLFVTGRLGGAFESGRHLTFTPRLDEAVALADSLGDRLTAMIDVSDGLGRDASRITDASGVRIEIEAGAIPVAEGVDEWRRAAADGEDYELLFTVAPGGAPPESLGGTPVTPIGRVVAGAGCVIRTPDGVEHDASELGWDHE